MRKSSLERGSGADTAGSEERYRLGFEMNMAPMIITDLEDRVIAANDAFCSLIGRSREEVLGFDSKPFTHPEDLGITESVIEQVTHGDTEQLRYVKRYLHKDGRLIIVEVSRTAARGADGEILYYVISERDITDRTRRDQVLELQAGVNRLAIVATSEDVFLRQLCELLVQDAGYALAWVGVMADGEEGGVDVVCAAGDTDYLYGDITNWWGSRDSGSGHAGAALRTGHRRVIGDLALEAPGEAWRDRALQFGFGSSAAIPFNSATEGRVLSIYAKQVFAFDEVTVKGLDEIGSEIGLAIRHVRSMQVTKDALDALTLANEALQETEQRFRLAFEDNMAPMIFTNLDNHVVAANDAFCRLIGYEREEILGRGTAHFTHADDLEVVDDPQRRLIAGEVDQVAFTKRYLSKDGRIIVITSLKSAARNPEGEILYFVSSQRDITEERTLAEQLSHQAFHDPLTGLANRSLFEDRLAQAHERLIRKGGFSAVMLLDLDDFKDVNDTYGHYVGDQMLIGVSQRLEIVTRSLDTLCRFGGDEFLYLAEGLTSPTQAEEIAARLLDALVEPFSFDQLVIEQHASIGIVVCDGTASAPSECVQEADVALYEAKRTKRGRHVVFNSSMQQ